MRIQTFLEHHGIVAIPFAEEDAQTDPVFKEHCIASTYHPTWDKIYGNPAEPAHVDRVRREGGRQDGAAAADRRGTWRSTTASIPTRGCSSSSTTTSIRSSIAFATSSARGVSAPDRVLAEWKLWDHMDAILSLGVTQARRSHPRARRRARWPTTTPTERSTGISRAICCCWPPATISRRPKRSRAAGIGCGGSCGSAPGRRSGTWRWASWSTVLAAIRLIVVGIQATLGLAGHALAVLCLSPPAGCRWLWRMWKWLWQARGDRAATCASATARPTRCGRC